MSRILASLMRPIASRIDAQFAVKSQVSGHFWIPSSSSAVQAHLATFANERLTSTPPRSGMAYTFRRDNKGSPTFTAIYEDPEGVRRSAGTYSSRRAALRAAQREEQAVLRGQW